MMEGRYNMFVATHSPRIDLKHKQYATCTEVCVEFVGLVLHCTQTKPHRLLGSINNNIAVVIIYLIRMTPDLAFTCAQFSGCCAALHWKLMHIERGIGHPYELASDAPTIEQCR